MRTFFGVLMIIGGIVLGLYVGVYLMLWGGIVSVIDGVKADPVNSGNIAWGIVRILFAGMVGTITFYALMIPGAVLLEKR